MDNFCSKSCCSRTKNILWSPARHGEGGGHRHRLPRLPGPPHLHQLTSPPSSGRFTLQRAVNTIEHLHMAPPPGGVLHHGPDPGRGRRPLRGHPLHPRPLSTGGCLLLEVPTHERKGKNNDAFICIYNCASFNNKILGGFIMDIYGLF